MELKLILLLTTIKWARADFCTETFPKNCNELNKNYKSIYIDCETCVNSEEETVKQFLKYFNKYNEDLTGLKEGVSLNIKQSFANICKNHSKKCEECLESNFENHHVADILQNCEDVKLYNEGIIGDFLGRNQEAPTVTKLKERACFCTYAVPTTNALFNNYFQNLEVAKHCNYSDIYRKYFEKQIDSCIL